MYDQILVNLGTERISFWRRVSRTSKVASPLCLLSVSHLSAELVLHKQPLLSNHLFQWSRDSRPPRTGCLSSFLVCLFSLHVSRFQTVCPSTLRKWEEEQESFDISLVRVEGGLICWNLFRLRFRCAVNFLFFWCACVCVLGLYLFLTKPTCAPSNQVNVDKRGVRWY